MILYCSGHESFALKVLTHKMKFYPNEEMIFMTPEETYPFCNGGDYGRFYKQVILVKAYIGHKTKGREAVLKEICHYFDELFSEKGIVLSELQNIYVIEDILFPFTIYFELRHIPYTTIEITKNSFVNKNTHTVENSLFGRSEDYFNISKDCGAFTGSGAYCIHKLYDADSKIPENHILAVERFDYIDTLMQLPQEKKDLLIDLYKEPANLPKDRKLSLLLTNSTGFITGPNPQIQTYIIPYIYQLLLDYYFNGDMDTYVKPHPNSQKINYKEAFSCDRILDDKFIVDLLPFIKGIRLDKTINISSSASAILEKFSRETVVIGSDYYIFYPLLHRIAAVFSYMEYMHMDLKSIVCLGINIAQLKKYLQISNARYKSAEITGDEYTEKNQDVILLYANDMPAQKTMDYLKNRLNTVRSCFVFIFGEKSSSENIAKNIRTVKSDCFCLHITKQKWKEQFCCAGLEDEFVMVITNSKDYPRAYQEERTLNNCNLLIHTVLQFPSTICETEASSSRFPSEDKICIMGGNVAREMAKYIENSNITYRLWISPLSFIHDRPDTSVNIEEENFSLKIELSKDLKQCLGGEGGYLILDLETLRYPLLHMGEYYYTNTGAFLNSNFYKMQKGAVNIDPMKADEMPEEWIKTGLSNFAGKILTCFLPEKIILVRHGKGLHAYVKNHVFKNWKTDAYNQWMEKWEDFFIEQTQCTVIDLWKHYFCKYEMKNGIIYEPYFYQNVLDYCIRYMERADSKRYQEPSFLYSLERYLIFYEFAVNRKYDGCFLNRDKWLPSYILDMGEQFIMKYRRILEDIEALEYSSVEDCLNRYDFTVYAEVKNAFLAIAAIRKADYSLNEEIYRLIFKENFRIVRQLENRLQKVLEERDIPSGLNGSNVESIFFLIRTELLHDLSFDKSIYKKCMENSGTEVDVWGSCVSRESLNICGGGWRSEQILRVKHYIMRVNALHTGQKKIPFPENMLSMDNFGKEFLLRNACLEMKRNLDEYLNRGHAEWLILDLFDISGYNLYYQTQDFPLCEVYNFRSTPFYQYYKKDLFELDYTQEQYGKDFFHERLHHAADILKKQYGRKIIILDVRWSAYYTDENHVIKRFDYLSMEKAVRKNAVLNLCEEYLQNSLNCYRIRFSKDFLADVMFMGGEVSSVHYEKEFYQEAYRIIHNIIWNEPEKKIYDSYSFRVKLQRIVKLSSRKQNLPYLYKMFNKSYLDHMLIEMDNRIIQENLEILTDIYEKGYSDKFEMLDRFPFESFHAEALRKAMMK